MTDKLPPNLLALFAPRPPLRWVPPADQAPDKRRALPVAGVAGFLPALEEYKEKDEYKPTESWLQMKDRKKLEKKGKVEDLTTLAPKLYKPNEDSNVRGDAFKTLMVARLSYEANEQDLEREFGRFGPIERIRIIADTHAHEKPKNKKRKPHRGYAFVVFERERDMRAALDSCDGIRIKDRRIKVDVERGRTVKGWKPRRLGGGLGGRGYTKALPARPMGGPGGFGGGFRGGFRGGFDGGRGRGFRGGFGGRGGFRGGGDFGPRGDRGGGDFGSRGDRSGGDFGSRGDRGGPNGYPRDAPSGPGYGGRGGDRGSGGGGFDRGGRSYDDRPGRQDRYGDRDSNRRTGSNMEPIRPRGDGGYRDRERDRDRRDYDRPRDDDSRKRGYDGGYEDPRKLRRY